MDNENADVTNETEQPPVPDDVSETRDWLKLHPFLPQDLSDEFLQTFLSSRPTAEEGRDVLMKYFRYRQDLYKVFRNRHPGCAHMERFGAGSVVPITSPDTDGWVIFWMDVLDTDSFKFDLFHHCKLIFIELDMLLQQNCVAGKTMSVVLNFENFSPKHYSRNTAYAVLLTRRLLMDAFPIKLGPFFILNPGEKVAGYTGAFPEFEYHIIDDVNDLSGFLPLEFLPSDYGGLPSSEPLCHFVEKFVSRLWENGSQFVCEELEWDRQQMIRLTIEDEKPKKKDKKEDKKKAKKGKKK